MNIVSIIANEDGEGLYSIQEEEGGKDAYTAFVERTGDIEYLQNYFEANLEKLPFFEIKSIEEAIEQTLYELEELQLWLQECATNEYNENLQFIFQPLYNHVYELQPYQKSKARLSPGKQWLRLYAIRLDANFYVITGGGIKLTATMQEDSLLMAELDKLSLVEDFLRDKSVLYPEDL